MDQERDDLAIRVGRHIRARRVNAGLSGAELAATVAISPAYLARIERGGANPTLDLMTLLSDALGCDVSALVAAGDAPSATDR